MAVAQSSTLTSMIASALGAGPWISLGLGLLGVGLSRAAFTTRQQRLGEIVTRKETLTITCMAMLIVGPIIWEYRLGMVTSVLVGLGAGWSSIALFDAIGARVTATISMLVPPLVPRAEGNIPIMLPPTTVPALPSDMVSHLETLDAKTEGDSPVPDLTPPPSEGP